MKVLFISASRGSAASPGGVEQLIRLLAPPLGERGVEVFLCCRKDGFPEGPLADNAHCLELDLPLPRILRSRASERRIIQFCRDNRIDLVHSHGVYRPSFAAQLVKRALGLPYVVTTHGELDPGYLPRQGFLFRQRCRLILRDASRVTYAAIHMAEYMKRLCDVSAKGQAIDNCIDLSWWRQAQPASGNYCLAVGILVAQKGHSVLIEALRLLAQAGVTLNLVVIGEGSQRQALENQAQQAGLGLCRDPRELSGAKKPTVCLCGYAHGQAKRDLVANCSFFAFPSQAGEGQPLVLLEAMACGKPIIASDLPCSRGLITPGTNGDLVPAADPTAWATAMKELLADAGRRQRYQVKVLSQIGRHDNGVVAEQYAALYRKVLASG